MTWDGQCSSSKQARDHHARYAFVGPVVVVDMQRCVMWSVVMDKVCNASEHSFDRASLCLAIGCMGKFLAFDSVLLSREREGDEGGREKLDVGVTDNIGEVLRANFELHILETEGVLGIASGVGILPWAEKEIESHPDTVDCGLILDRGS